MATNKEQKTEQEVSVKTSFVQKHSKKIIAGVAAVVIAIVGIFCYKNLYSNPREVNASTAIAPAQQVFQEAFMMESDSLYNIALNGDKAKKTAGFLQVINDYSGTKAANLANLYAGLCYAHMEKWQEAQKYIEEFDEKDDAMVSPLAHAALGSTYANLKQIDKAIEAYKKAAEMADDECIDETNNTVSPMCVLEAARLLKSQNKNKEALELLQAAEKKYVNSNAVNSPDFQTLVAELNQIVK